MKYLLTMLTTIMAVAMFAIAPPVLAQTPDGQTPAQETVCDPLQADGVTKGLYGLCVAFCEAHDAADVDAPITEDQLSDILALSPNGRILKTYNKKKDKANNPADPDMPCVRVQEPCPCWTAAEIASVDGFLSDGTATDVFTVVGSRPICREEGYPSSGDFEKLEFLSYDGHFGPDTGVCRGYSYTTSGGELFNVTLWYYGAGDTNNTLTLEQRDSCTAQVLDCVDRNTP